MVYNAVQQRHLSLVTQTNIMEIWQEQELVLKICRQH